MSIKKALEDLTGEKAPGPTPSFSVYDAIKALWVIAETGSVGRGKLSEKIGLGKGATRTLLARLTEAHLISTSRSGCSLTKKGRELWRMIRELIPHISEIGPNELTFAEHSVLVHVRGRGERIRRGLEQRDAAVRAGARGAITMIYRDNKLTLPAITDDAAQAYPLVYEQVTRLLDLEENDVAIIVCADTQREAEYGALAAAWTII
jgi:predicted transcriptional regulator